MHVSIDTHYIGNVHVRIEEMVCNACICTVYECII